MDLAAHEPGHLLTIVHKTRRKYSALALVAALSCAVFLWGLQSKLALYHPAGVHAGLPIAKLLTQKERPLSSARVERVLLSSQPFPNASLEVFPVGVAAIPTNLLRNDLMSSEEGCARPGHLPALLWQHLSRIGPRAPPIVTS